MNPLSTKAQPISFSDLLSRKPPVATERLAYGTDAEQFGELWLPEGPPPYPMVIMIHGGCWQASLPGVVLMAYIAEDLRKSGIAVWNIEYRRLGNSGGGYPGTFNDIATGIDYLKTISGKYKLDLSNIIILGHSAGGQLALWATARDHIKPTSELYRNNPLPIHTVVTLAGINDLKNYRNNGPSACGGPSTIDHLINASGRKGQDPYIDTSPAAMLPLGTEQFIVAGALDPIVPSRFGSDYATLAKAAGDKVKFTEIENAGHFELIDPQSSAWAEVKKTILAYALKR